MYKKNFISLIGIIAIVLITVFMFLHAKWLDQDLKNGNGIPVVGTIKFLLVTRSGTEATVAYLYGEKIITSSFKTYDADSLKEGVKVRLLISKLHPTEGIKHVGAGVKYH